MKVQANILPLIASVGLAIFAVLAESKPPQDPEPLSTKVMQIAGKGVDISAVIEHKNTGTQAKQLVAILEGRGVDIS